MNFLSPIPAGATFSSSRAAVPFRQRHHAARRREPERLAFRFRLDPADVTVSRDRDFVNMRRMIRRRSKRGGSPGSRRGRAECEPAQRVMTAAILQLAGLRLLCKRACLAFVARMENAA